MVGERERERERENPGNLCCRVALDNDDGKVYCFNKNSLLPAVFFFVLFCFVLFFKSVFFWIKNVKTFIISSET